MPVSSEVKAKTKHMVPTVDIRRGSGKFIVEERSKEEALRLFVETALCIVVGVIFLGSFLLFIMPEIEIVKNYSGFSMSAVMSTLALLLYIYATRGTRPQAGFDSVKQQFWTCKINAKGHARIVTYYAKAEIQGVFIRRPADPQKNAALCARIRGKLVPIKLIQAPLAEIEAAHRELCDALHNANIVLPEKPALASQQRRARPKSRATAA